MGVLNDVQCDMPSISPDFITTGLAALSLSSDFFQNALARFQCSIRHVIFVVNSEDLFVVLTGLSLLDCHEVWKHSWVLIFDVVAMGSRGFLVTEPIRMATRFRVFFITIVEIS